MIFCIENTQYYMGFPIDRHSSIQDCHQMGNLMAGLRINGTHVLAVKEGIRFAKEWCASGNGPMYVEMMTHQRNFFRRSHPDPGTTYRKREEIDFTRTIRDPLEFVKKAIVNNGFADEAELDAVEKRIRQEVAAVVMKAKESAKPSPEELTNCIFASSLALKPPSEYPPHIRMPNYEMSYWADGKIE